MVKYTNLMKAVKSVVVQAIGTVAAVIQAEVKVGVLSFYRWHYVGVTAVDR
jgi:hypothetical protein